MEKMRDNPRITEKKDINIPAVQQVQEQAYWIRDNFKEK